jgi:cell division transport system permease protein
MKNIIYNKSYFIKEVKTMIGLDVMSNILSILSIGFIFFILVLVLSGWKVSSSIVKTIQGEAEINVYCVESTGDAGAAQLAQKIKALEGVREVRLVDEGEAYNRMVDILGKEAAVLKYLDDNPFSPFIEVKIQMENMDSILEKLDLMTEVEHVRDNREVLDRLQSLSEVLRLVGYLIVIAVGISTLIIISHIIRLGIHNNSEQISTLRLLGAPEAFIALPFLLEGLVLTLGGGILSSIMALFTIKGIYARMAGPLPFIPLPPLNPLLSGLILMIMLLSAGLGISGSIMGMSSAKDK